MDTADERAFQACSPFQGSRKGQYISLKDPLTSLRSKRIKQVDKIKELIIRLKWLRWRHIAFLRFILVVDLLDFTAVIAQAPWWHNPAPPLFLQAVEQRPRGPLRVQ